MDPTSTTGTGLAPAGNPPPAAPVVAPGGGSKSTPEQRAKWRAKWARAKARKLGQAAPALPPGPLPPAAPDAPGATPPAAPGATALPWDPGCLRPLFEQLVPALEKADVAALTAQAREVNPDLVPMVEKSAAWNPAAKASIQAAGPVAAAKWLTKSGIGSENAPEVVLAVAVGGILASRLLVVAELRRVAGEKPAPSPAPPASP